MDYDSIFPTQGATQFVDCLVWIRVRQSREGVKNGHGQGMGPKRCPACTQCTDTPPKSLPPFTCGRLHLSKAQMLFIWCKGRRLEGANGRRAVLSLGQRTAVGWSLRAVGSQTGSLAGRPEHNTKNRFLKSRPECPPLEPFFTSIAPFKDSNYMYNISGCNALPESVRS